MKIIHPSPLLKIALRIDALASGATGVLQLALSEQLATLLEVPRALLVGSGEFMLVYALALLVMASRTRLPSWLVMFIVIGNGLWALLNNPGELAKLRADPALVPSAVEEMLRYDGPSGAQVRVVKVEQELRGKLLKPGDRVFLMLNAANRDPEAYEQPDRLHLARGGPAHLTFGFGMHICLGFPLARMEGQVALPAVARNVCITSMARRSPCVTSGSSPSASQAGSPSRRGSGRRARRRSSPRASCERTVAGERERRSAISSSSRPSKKRRRTTSR